MRYLSQIGNAVYRRAGVMLSPIVRSSLVTDLVATPAALEHKPLLMRGADFGSVSQSPPGITTADVYFDPRFNGVCTFDGALIECSALVRGRQNAYFNSPPKIDVEARESMSSCIYGGILFGTHFGHFLTETMSRLWPLVDPRYEAEWSDLPIVFRTAKQRGFPDEVYAFAKTVLKALGIWDRIIVPEQPVMIKECIIPHAAIVNNQTVHHEYIELMQEIGSRLLKGIDCRNGELSGKYYLSRSRLPSRTRRLANEKKLEAALRREGFQIVHPEKLTIEEQVRIFHTAKEVVGPIGSAFHTVPLAVNPELTVKYLVHYDPSLPSTYNNIDAALGQDAVCIQCVYRHPLNMKESSFCDQIIDLERAVDGIVKTAPEVCAASETSSTSCNPADRAVSTRARIL